MRRLWLVLVLLSTACADEIPEDVSAGMEAARAARQMDGSDAPDLAELLRAAPAGGHADWIGDIRQRLDTVPILAEVDRGEAQHAVQELYTRRFDVLRQFYGSEGAIDAGAAVAQAVDEADARLQQLIRQLATDESNGAAIGEAVRSAQAALENIENATRAAGLPPTAPRDTIPTSP